MRWGFILLVLLVACLPLPEVIDSSADKGSDRIVPVSVEHVIVQCFDGSTRERASDCPKPKAAAKVNETVNVSSAPPTVRQLLEAAPKSYFFQEDGGDSFLVSGTLRRATDVVWDTKKKKAWVFLADMERSWYVQHGGKAPPGSGWTLPAYIEVNITFNPAADKASLPKFSKTTIVWQNLQPIYVEGPIDVLARFAGVEPMKVETAEQSVRVLKKEIASNLSLHFADGNHTTVLKIDSHYGVPFVVEEYVDFHRTSRRAFLFSPYGRNDEEMFPVTKERVGLPKDAIIITPKRWEAYREFEGNKG